MTQGQKSHRRLASRLEPEPPPPSKSPAASKERPEPGHHADTSLENSEQGGWGSVFHRIAQGYKSDAKWVYGQYRGLPIGAKFLVVAASIVLFGFIIVRII